MRSNWIASALVAAVFCGMAVPTVAQTTHVVTLSGVSFSPADLVIDVGDTVQWNWASGFHNVKSGVDGLHDGNFSSGVPVAPPNSFSITFDTSFLAAHPMAGDYYPYYCDPHVSLGMVGSVKVGTPASAVFRNDAGNTNLATYANVTPPVLGGFWDSTIDVSSHAGAFGALIVGYGGALEFPSAFGWILVDFTHPAGQLLQLTSLGSGVVPFHVPVPSDPALCGFSLSTQGVVLGGGIALTNAQDLVLGV